MTKRDREYLSRAADYIGITLQDAEILRKKSRQLQIIGVRICNGFHKGEERREKWNRTRMDSICREIEELLLRNYHGHKFFYHQSDPRGAQVYIIDMDNVRMNNAWQDYCYREYCAANPKNFHYWISSVYNQYGVAF